MDAKRNSAFDKLMEEKGGLADPDAEDSWESPTGDGRINRQQVFALQLIDEQKRMVVIPYSSIIWGEGQFNGKSFRFEFVRGDDLWEAVIEGNLELQRVVDKITAGKRESVRVNEETVRRVVWSAVQKEK